jgi:hypothetical protein
LICSVAVKPCGLDCKFRAACRSKSAVGRDRRALEFFVVEAVGFPGDDSVVPYRNAGLLNIFILSQL